MVKPGNMAGYHKDDLEQLVVRLLNGVEFTDGLDHRVRVEAHREPGQEPVAIITDHKGRVTHTQFRIGR